jgi:hypothetical protein
MFRFAHNNTKHHSGKKSILKGQKVIFFFIVNIRKLLRFTVKNIKRTRISLRYKLTIFFDTTVKLIAKLKINRSK